MKHQNRADDAPGQPPAPEVISALENRLRMALRARASDVAVPAPLELPSRRGTAGTPASTKWLASVAAAIVVLGIIGGALAVAGALPARHSGPAGPIETTVPPYYVALIGRQLTSHFPVATLATVAAVRATSTGAVVASVSAPRPYSFLSVTAAADDRSFVVLAVGPSTPSAQPAPYNEIYAQRFFMLRIDPTAPTPAARARLTVLPHAGIASGLQVEAMALAPNGRSLAAVFTDPSRAIGAVVPGQLTVFNLADGARRTWIREVCAYGRCAPGPIGGESISENPSLVQLSWTSDGRSLLFLSGPVGSQARVLDVDTPGRSLIADSHLLPIRTEIPNWADVVITPDGQSVFVESNTNTLLRVSATTGKTEPVIQVVRNADRLDYLLWTNDSGSKIVVFRAELAPPGVLMPSGQTAVIYSGRRNTPLRWPTGVVDAAW